MNRSRALVTTLTVFMAALLQPVAYAEIHGKETRTRPDSELGARDATERRIIVNGIGSTGRSWVVRQSLTSFAEVAVKAALERGLPIPPRVEFDAAGFKLVQFQPAEGGEFQLNTAHARVLIARPTTREGETSVWEADIPMLQMLRQMRESASGVAPGRDHPILGAPAGARRVNVVEVVDSAYSYSAVYLVAGGPAEVLQNLLARFTAMGASVDGRTTGPDDARAALTLAAGRIDFSVIRAADTGQSRIVIQTDIPPNIQARESR